MKNHSGKIIGNGAKAPLPEKKEISYSEFADKIVLELMDQHHKLSKIGMAKTCTHLHFTIDLLGKAMTALGASSREDKKVEKRKT